MIIVILLYTEGTNILFRVRKKSTGEIEKKKSKEDLGEGTTLILEEV